MHTHDELKLAFSIEFSEPRADIWVIDAKDFTDSTDVLRSFLAEDELVRYERFACQQSAATYLAARAGLRFLLSCYLNLPARSFVIKTEANGKPFVENLYNLYFNVSHSSHMIVIAFAGNRLGVDIEHLERKVDLAAILRRFFSPTEQSSWAQYQQADTQRTFFRGWTRKEAVLKATGEGIAGLAHNEISFAPDLQKAMISYCGSKDAAVSWFFYELEPAPDFIAALACQVSLNVVRELRLLPEMVSAGT
ncbi:MAG: 4'-phosphopantetheinyl transferase superfamily protein [Candidatus Riflebacteria bacterium]|nr:4'-phosphopantetheinyl transferase superfamily protein [Candidatus Riflebacteria bacterium]